MHAALRRTPGITFLSVPTPALPTLPPLDVAGFVGFTMRGPCDVAVPVDDLAGFDAIFGGTSMPLARDAAGSSIPALLRDAIAAFFSAGGRRCYVVRVIGAAASRARFAVPGLVALSDGRASVATVDAAWQGRWSDDAKIGTILEVTPLPRPMFKRAGDRVLHWNPASAPNAVQTGDVLRATFGGMSLLFPVASVSAIGSDFHLAANLILRWSPDLAGSLPMTVTAAALLSGDGTAERPLTAVFDNGSLRLTGHNAASVAPGHVLRIAVAGGPQRLVSVAAVGALAGGDRIVTLGEAIEPPDAGALPAVNPDRIERLRFAITIKNGTQSEPLLDQLGYNGGHQRFWGDVVPGASGSLAGGTFTPGEATRLYADLAGDQRADLDWTDPRLRAVAAALLAPASSNPTYLPLGMAVFSGDLVGPTVGGADALDLFDERPFIDPSLAQAFPPSEVVPLDNPRALMPAAANRLFVQNLKLKGMHALLFVDEVALVSVPDAVQPGWHVGEQLPPAPAVVPLPAPPPRTGFRVCTAPLAILSVSPASGPLRGGTEVVITGSGFVPDIPLQVSIGGRNAGNPVMLDNTHLRCVTPPGTAIGLTDVTLRRDTETATLANGFSYIADVTAADLPVVVAPTRYDMTPLIKVHAALTVLCQARADAAAVLSLPRHFEKRDCINWLQQFRVALNLPASGPAPVTDLQPDIADLSYAAVYHPWLLIPDTLARTPTQKALPPDGAACGLIAARELARQVWIAPANMPIPGLVDLEPTISDTDWADMFALGFNLVRAEAKDFRVMSAHTLADDASLLQLSVRRLLIQLRKALLQRGNTYVFESNTPAFRQSVRSGLEALLRFMFNGGAFAGATEPLSFGVSVSDDLNTPQAMAAGQMIARIAIAPSQPMEFISVLLSRNADGGLQAAERRLNG
jgi:hypothetical protein